MTKNQRIFHTVITAVIMSICMSFFMTLFNIGFVDDFLFIWITSCLKGFLVTLPLSFIIPVFTGWLIKKLRIE